MLVRRGVKPVRLVAVGGRVGPLWLYLKGA